ncbi:HAD family hydrolase [Paenibacillus solisilvae]|uniref:HAD family hydrolase n=1 Tax=Paenibacillus solisilvae TaxID=2486751 RepID=A0ABW0W8L9_9BACL
MNKPQLILDAAGVLVANLSPDYWNGIHSLTGISYEKLKALFKDELRSDFWSGKVPERRFWEWLQEKAPQIDIAAAQRLLMRELKPLAAMSHLASWSQWADLHVLSNHRSEWLAPLLEPVSQYLKSVTISSSVGCCKPDPRIFNRVHTKLYESAAIVYVDDQEKNRIPASQLGWHTIIADPHEHWIEQVHFIISGTIPI